MDDVRVLQLSGKLGLVDEHRDELVVVREVRQDALDRDDLLKSLDAAHARPIDLGHPAGGDGLDQLVLAEGCAAGERAGNALGLRQTHVRARRRLGRRLGRLGCHRTGGRRDLRGSRRGWRCRPCGGLRLGDLETGEGVLQQFVDRNLPGVPAHLGRRLLGLGQCARQRLLHDRIDLGQSRLAQRHVRHGLAIGVHCVPSLDPLRVSLLLGEKVGEQILGGYGSGRLGAACSLQSLEHLGARVGAHVRLRALGHHRPHVSQQLVVGEGFGNDVLCAELVSVGDRVLAGVAAHEHDERGVAQSGACP